MTRGGVPQGITACLARECLQASAGVIGLTKPQISQFKILECIISRTCIDAPYVTPCGYTGITLRHTIPAPWTKQTHRFMTA